MNYTFKCNYCISGEIEFMYIDDKQDNYIFIYYNPITRTWSIQYNKTLSDLDDLSKYTEEDLFQLSTIWEYYIEIDTIVKLQKTVKKRLPVNKEIIEV